MKSEAIKVKVEKNRAIVMKDDVRLYCDVYRPDDQEKYPVLVGFSPFGKAAQQAGRQRDPIQLGSFMYEQGIEIAGIDTFVAEGYIVVIANPRGIENSEGVWTGLLSRQDQEDCCEVIRWAGHYLSDGNVGMTGSGYAGKIQPLVASLNPVYLKAIMPVDVMDDFYLDCYPGGILSDINYPLCSYIPHTRTISEAELEQSEQDLKAMLEQAKNQPEIATNSYYYRGLDTFPPRHYTWNIDILLHPFKSEWWERRSFGSRKVTIPTYIVGLYYEYGTATVSAYDIYNKIDDSVPKKLLMIDPAYRKTSPYVKPLPEAIRWFAYWLKGEDTKVMEEPPMKLFVMGEERCRYEYNWPCKDLEYKKLYFNRGNRLEEVPDQVAEYVDKIRHIPPVKQSQMPEDVPALTYTSSIFEEDTEICGVPYAYLSASIDQENAHLAVKLWDKDSASGYRTLLATGYLKCSRQESDSGKKHNGFTVSSHTKENVVEPGVIYEYTIEMSPVHVMLKKNHQAEVEFKTMDQQYFDFKEMASLPRLYTSGRVAGPHPMATEVHFEIHLAGKHTSRIELPVTKGIKNWIE